MSKATTPKVFKSIDFFKILRRASKYISHLRSDLSEAMDFLPDGGSSSRYTSGIPEPPPEDEVLLPEWQKSFRQHS